MSAVLPVTGEAPRTSDRGAIVAGLLALAALVLGLGGLSLVDIAGAVVASGSISSQGRPKAVQHLDGGIVRDIRVKNGSAVTKGDLLISLDDTQLRANVEIYRNRLLEGMARRARLQAERDGRAAIDWDSAAMPGLDDVGSSAEHRASQHRLFDVRRAARNGQNSQRGEKVKQFQNQIVGTKGLIASKGEQIASLERELADLRGLHKDGYVPSTRILSLERDLASLQGQVIEHRSDLARLGNGIDETRIGDLQAEREFQENVLAELRQLTTEVNDIAQQYRAAREALARVDIRAPDTGTVHELNTFTIGGVVPPGGTLMHLVPSEEGLGVDAQVDPQFIDQIAAGQAAIVRFPAFQRDTTPEVDGVVSTVSPTSVQDERTGASFYRIEVRIAPAELARVRQRTVVPGMPVEVFLRTSERSILSYLLKPVRDQVQRAMREK